MAGDDADRQLTSTWAEDDTLSQFIVDPVQQAAELVGTSTEGFRRELLTGVVLHERYRVGELLGTGGMGEVYAAEHITIHRAVAIKVLNIRFAHQPQVVSRFLQEARAASAIGHPNVVDILDFGETPAGSVYFVMERLIGEDLSRTLAREGPMPWSRARPIALQICRALRSAHAHRIVHRDLKPSNCFLVRRDDADEFIKVVDFGIAKVLDDGPASDTKSGVILGSPAYMSPQQIRGETVDHRSDIYSFGVMLFELLTGTRPFERSTLTAVLMAHLFDTPPRLRERAPDIEVDAGVEELVAKAMAKDPGDRFQTIEAMSRAIAGDEPAIHDDEIDPSSKPFRWGRLVVALAGAAGLLWLGAKMLQGPDEPSSERTVSESESETGDAEGQVPFAEPEPIPDIPNEAGLVPADLPGDPEPEDDRKPKLTDRQVAAAYARTAKRAVRSCGEKHGQPVGTTLPIKFTLSTKTGRVTSVEFPSGGKQELQQCAKQVMEQNMEVEPFRGGRSYYIVTHEF